MHYLVYIRYLCLKHENIQIRHFGWFTFQVYSSELYIISGVRHSVTFHKRKVKPKWRNFTSSARPLTLFFSALSVTSSKVLAERGLALDIKFRHFGLTLWTLIQKLINWIAHPFDLNELILNPEYLY